MAVTVFMSAAWSRWICGSHRPL